MRKHIYTILVGAVALLCSCEEFQPVFTSSYGNPAPEKIYTEAEIAARGLSRKTIAEVKEMYRAKGVFEVSDDIYVKGQVVSSDSTGNFYKSFYFQDETGGIELRLGRYNLCNEYKLNQWVYVSLNGLTVGAYYGSLQIGFQDESEKYETSNIEVQRLVDTHLFKGEMGSKVLPRTITASDLNGAYSPVLETLVRIDGLKYSNAIFCLLYLNPNLPSEERDKNHSSQRVFLSDSPCGVTTWAMSEEKFKENLNSGIWDSKTNGSDSFHPEISGKTVKWLRENGYFVPSAYTVSQEFKLGSQVCPIRTSGYAKFCDQQMPDAILRGASVSVVGVVTYYNGTSPAEYQITVNSLEDIKY